MRPSQFGLGVFAKRPFTVGEKVVTERVVIKMSKNLFLSDPSTNFQSQIEFRDQFGSLPLSAKEAIVALHPAASFSTEDVLFDNFFGPGALQYKYNNFAQCNDHRNDEYNGLCITASRFNHSCIPNCGRTYIIDHQLMTIFVQKPILEGEEMFISYTFVYEKGAEAFKAHTMEVWKFECTCHVCKDPELFNKLVQVYQNDPMIYTLGSTGQEKKAYELGMRTIELYDELGGMLALKARTLYDMFQVAVTRRSTLSKAGECARRNLDTSEIIYGGSKREPWYITKARANVEHPERHRLFCMNER